jgi:large subunit ribosomal protein L25
MTRPQLTAQVREITGKEVARLRRQGQLPCVVYGHGIASQSIVVDAKEFETLHRKTSRNALIDLRVGTERARPVLLHAVQHNPVSRAIVHVDFFLVRMSEEMTVDVPLTFVGESAAVAAGGTLLHPLDSIKVRALPGDLPQSLEVDISSLDTFDALIHVSDITIPEGATLVSDPGEAVARVAPPRVEEEEPTVEEMAPDAADVPETDEVGGGAESAADVPE